MKRITDKQRLNFLTKRFRLSECGFEWDCNLGDPIFDVSGFIAPRKAIDIAIRADRASKKNKGGKS